MRRRDHLYAILRFLLFIPVGLICMLALLTGFFVLMIPLVITKAIPQLTLLMISHPLGLVAPKTGSRLYNWCDRKIVEDTWVDRAMDKWDDIAGWPLDRLEGR